MCPRLLIYLSDLPGLQAKAGNTSVKKVEPIKKILIIGGIIVALFCSVLVVKIPVVSNALDGAEFCGSCHVMEPEVEGYLHANHRNAASCNDCHTPHTLVAGSYYKAYTGAKDMAFVIMGQTDDIAAGDTAKKIIQQNCVDCHSDLLTEVGDTMDRGRSCTDCHSTVYH